VIAIMPCFPVSSERQQQRPVSPASRRSGFTLTELLVVMVILGILSSLLLAGLAVARDRVRVGKTAATIRKIHEVVLAYYEDYEVRRPNLPDTSSLNTQDYEKLHRIALRRLMTLEMPDQAADIPHPDELRTAGGKPYATAVQGLSLKEMPPAARRYRAIIAGADVPSPSSAEILYMMVMRGPMSDPDVIAHFRPDEIGDTDGNGLPEFLDAWGRPIRFRRWPVGIRSPLQPADGGPDLLISQRGYALMPLIYSAGTDGNDDVANGLTPPPPAGYAARAFEPFSDTDPVPSSLSAISRDDITNHDLLR